MSGMVLGIDVTRFSELKIIVQKLRSVQTGLWCNPSESSRYPQLGQSAKDNEWLQMPEAVIRSSRSERRQ